MKPLHEQEPRLRVPVLRRTLLRIHTDLFKIDGHARRGSAYYPEYLTNLDKLCMVLEDRRFLKHSGVDLKSVLRETLKALTFRRHGGASTIDMQFVRTCTGYREWTIGRKLYEMLLAVLIQFRYSKIVILRSYLAIAYFGTNLKGANRASRSLFGKPVVELTLDEAAVLAAMLVYPRPQAPSSQWELKVNRRADYGKRVYIAQKERFDQLPR